MVPFATLDAGDVGRVMVCEFLLSEALPHPAFQNCGRAARKVIHSPLGT